MRAAVISGRYAPPVLQPAEHIFDLMALFIQSFIVRNLAFSVLLRGYARRDPLVQQAIPEPIGVIAAICKKMFGGGEVMQQPPGPLVV